MVERRNDSELYYFIYFKKLYESWEKTMSHALKSWMRTPLFTNSMVNAIEKSVEFKNYMQEVMERTLRQRYFVMRSGDIDKETNHVDSLKSKKISSSENIKKVKSKNGLTSKEKKSGKSSKRLRRKKDESRKI